MSRFEIYIYIYIYMCVCVCVYCFSSGGLSEGAINKGNNVVRRRSILYLGAFRKSVEKIQFRKKKNLRAGTVHEEVCTFMKMSR